MIKQLVASYEQSLRNANPYCDETWIAFHVKRYRKSLKRLGARRV